jgi:hypothetical protein
MQVTINGQQHTLVYRFRALRLLGVRGASDSEGLAKCIQDAAASWESLSMLIAIGIGRKPEDPREDVAAFVDDLDYPALTELMNGIAECMGVSITTQKPVEGEQSGPPDQSKDGTSAELSLVSISA